MNKDQPTNSGEEAYFTDSMNQHGHWPRNY